MITEELYANRRYVIFDVSEIEKIDFSQTFEESELTLRKSVDGTKTFVKYDLPQPSSVESLLTKSQEYTHSEILAIMSTPDWTPVMQSL